MVIGCKLDGRIAFTTLNRPDVLNVIDLQPLNSTASPRGFGLSKDLFTALVKSAQGSPKVGHPYVGVVEVLARVAAVMDQAGHLARRPRAAIRGPDVMLIQFLCDPLGGGVWLRRLICVQILVRVAARATVSMAIAASAAP